MKPTALSSLDDACLRADLRKLLVELERTPCVSARARSTDDRSAGSSSRLQRAQRELVAVHEAEFALLLRRAARLRLAPETDGLAACQAGLREVLECARADGLRWPATLERLARRLAGQGLQHWPRALRLARCAHALAPCSAARSLLAEALAAEGDAGGAAALLAEALLQRPSSARTQVLLAQLVRLLERLPASHSRRVLSQHLECALRTARALGAA